MVSLISIGIEKYENANKNSRGLNNIPCAYSDAKKIYNAFDKVLEEDMKRYASACIRNVTALECKVLLSAIELSIEREDIFIFYFSGHGLVESNGKLKLAFSDYGYDDRKGVVALEEIVSILKDYGCRVVLILDCCYSGAGLCESGRDDPKLEESISLFTSNGAIGKAHYDENGSEFTSRLCKALMKLCDEQQDISLDNMYNMVYADYNKCKIVTGGGKADIIFRKKNSVKFPQDFSDMFVNKMCSADYEMREALWYSAGYLPLTIKAEILEAFQKKKGTDQFAEMSWRVRRAIGSTLEYGVNDRIDQQIKQFIEADNWMEKCIGYISVRKNFSSEITDCMCNELRNQEMNNPMDLIWLVTLYLADRRDQFDEKLVLQSNLMKSVWGATEIWKRYFKDMPVEERLKLFEQHLDAKIFIQLQLELDLRRDIQKISQKNAPTEIRNHLEDIRKLYNGKSRGRIEGSKDNKWIFSILYGNWRDQVDLNQIMDSILRSKRKDDKSKFLRSLKYVPSVEIKMAVLEYFATKSKIEKYHVDLSDLEWALGDEHPWVIRTALPLFQGREELVEKNLNTVHDMNIYPGVFDLSIELLKQGFENINYEIENMTDIEENQLKWAKDRERRH